MSARRLLVLAVLALAACRKNAVPPPPPRPMPGAITIAPDVPSDVQGGAKNADLRTAARYAWNEFIALNWPAKDGVRDTADPNRKFGEQTGAVVWETFRSKVEIYPGNGNADNGPHGWNQTNGYDEPPLYAYKSDVPPCSGQSAVQTPAWVNLDEVSQIGFDHMFAGKLRKAGIEPLIRFSAKANRVHYDYVVANKFWYKGNAPFDAAAANFVAAVANNAFPPKGPYVDFPDGMIEIKPAFRRLTADEVRGKRFHTTRVRYYENANGSPCWREDTWGLTGLHIIQKTKSAPAFTWATFEQADNILDEHGNAAENADGKVVHLAPPNTPPLVHQDGAPYQPGVIPIVKAEGPYCTDPGARLYYRDVATDPTTGETYPNVPNGGDICVGARMHPIPRAIIDINEEAHHVIDAYDKQHRLKDSPWRHYKLINVQTWPFNKTDIVANPDSNRGAPAYHTSNITIETDYTLQNHSGGPETKTGGAPSDIASNFLEHAPQPPPSSIYMNTYLLDDKGNFVARYNMGGCTGCHGLTQIRAGSDFSYILFESSVFDPETPDVKPVELTRKYLGRF